MTTFYCLRFETPPTWRASSPYLFPQEQGGPVIPPGTGFPFIASYDTQGYGGGIRPRPHGIALYSMPRACIYVFVKKLPLSYIMHTCKIVNLWFVIAKNIVKVQIMYNFVMI
jgi:hypothetical protein